MNPRLVKLSTRTEVDIKRSFPQPALRRIGAWVFLDHFGPTEQVDGMVVAGEVTLNGQTVGVDDLIYLEVGEKAVVSGAGTAILLGGEPFDEHIVMWWNFIGRSHAEIVAWREAWNAQGADWPSFEDKVGGWIPAPEMPNVTLNPRR